MRKTLIIAIVVLLVFGGLLLAARIRAPQEPPPTTQEIWQQEGVPVEVSTVVIGEMEQTVEVTGDIKSLDRVTLSPKVAGKVAAVYAREGDRVGNGQTVVLLDQDDALSNVRQAQSAVDAAAARLSQARTNAKVTRIQTDAGIEQAQATLDAALARLAVVKDPARSQERMVAENNVASAKANLDNAEANYKRYQQLYKQGAVPEATLDTYRTQFAVAQAAYKSAQQQLSLIKEGGRSEDVEAAQSQVQVAREQLRTAKANAANNLLRQEDIRSAEAALRQARAGLDLARQQLAYTYIRSPISGRVSARLTEPGQVVAPGQAVGEVVSLASLYFLGDVSETEFEGVREGQDVRVRVDAIPGRVFAGRLDRIYPAASTQSRNFPVRVRIDDSSEEIRPGMFARGEIVVGVGRGVLLVPKDAVEERRGTKMVFTVSKKTVEIPARNGKPARRQVIDVAHRHDIDVVHENREFVQVRRPTQLRAGDVVVTRGRQNLQDGTRISVGNNARG